MELSKIGSNLSGVIREGNVKLLFAKILGTRFQRRCKFTGNSVVSAGVTAKINREAHEFKF